MDPLSPGLSVIIATVSTRRYSTLIEGGNITDVSGDLAEKLLKKCRMNVLRRVLIKDDPKMIREVVDMAIRENVDILIFIGGTGVAKDDVTVETLRPLFDKVVPSFNTLYVLYSEKEIGPRAMSSRASAGFIKNTLVYAIPGSPDAVQLCIERLICPEARHLISIYRGHKH